MQYRKPYPNNKCRKSLLLHFVWGFVEGYALMRVNIMRLDRIKKAAKEWNNNFVRATN